MGKLYIFNFVTLDGFFEGPNRDLSWHNVDREFNEFAIKQLDEIDVLLFGRVTYQMMASYWTTPTAIRDDPIVASKMNSLPKIVFSRTLEKIEWNNTRLVTENIAEEIRRLKQLPGKYMAIFGSSDLALTFMQHGLIDEYRIIVNPVILGSGKSLFNGIHDRLKLKLLKTKTFSSGNVLLNYEPVKK
ncbi:MAG: dihydrofolate reductase family protein [Candidatus Kryptoniota bacterium]